MWVLRRRRVDYCGCDVIGILFHTLAVATAYRNGDETWGEYQNVECVTAAPVVLGCTILCSIW